MSILRPKFRAPSRIEAAILLVLPLAILMVIWTAAEYSVSDDQGSGVLAAWLQAWFTLATGAAAIWIYASQRFDADKLRKNEHAVRGSCLAAGMYADTLGIAIRIDAALKLMVELVPKLATLPPENIIDCLVVIHEGCELTIPTSISANTDILYLLGVNQGTNIARLMAGIVTWNAAPLQLKRQKLTISQSRATEICLLSHKLAASISKWTETAIDDIERATNVTTDAVEERFYKPRMNDVEDIPSKSFTAPL